jgi:hypothetical protein
MIDNADRPFFSRRSFFKTIASRAFFLDLPPFPVSAQIWETKGSAKPNFCPIFA